jgi:hypothetical protein
MKYFVFGISEQIINSFKPFLSNITQTVLLENMTSSKIPVTSCVLQGACVCLNKIRRINEIDSLKEPVVNSQCVDADKKHQQTESTCGQYEEN